MATPHSKRERYPLNAPGDFYVANWECIICCAPEHAAPMLMGFFDAPDDTNEASHCYFKRQPETAAETRLAVDAVCVSCCGALRYAGSNRDIIAELRRRGSGNACDEPSRPDNPR